MIYLSVVIPIRNEEEFILDTLKSLINQDYPKERYELIIVDGHSTDKTCDIVKDFILNHNDAQIYLHDNPGLLSSRARNIGAKKARGKLIAVIDGHVHIPNNKLFSNMEKLKEKTGAMCLSRPAPLDVPGISENSTAYWIAASRKSWIGHSRNSFIYSDFEGFIDPMSSGFAYDSSVFQTIGNFDENFDAAEDVEFHFRLKDAGIEAYTSPEFLIYSYPRESIKSLFIQQLRYGFGRGRLVWKHRKAFTKETMIPSLLFIFFVSSPLFAITFTKILFLSIPYILFFSLYWLILLGTGLFVSLKKKKIFPGILIALSIWVTHMGLGWGFIKAIYYNLQKNN